MPVYTCRACGEAFPNFGAMGSHRKAAHPAPEAPRVARVRIESMAGPAADPSPDAGPALPPTGEDRPAGPSVAPQVLRITPEARAQSTREAVTEAFTAEVLADLLVSLSRAVSDLDGAGDAGVLSRVQAAQVAVLLHDAAVDLVIERFRGDVTRFKAALAVLLVLLSKGAVHARAVQRKLAERRPAPIPVDTPPQDEQAPGMRTSLRGLSNEDIARINAMG